MFTYKVNTPFIWLTTLKVAFVMKSVRQISNETLCSASVCQCFCLVLVNMYEF